jgi:hypothetical protein
VLVKAMQILNGFCTMKQTHAILVWFNLVCNLLHERIVILESTLFFNICKQLSTFVENIEIKHHGEQMHQIML